MNNQKKKPILIFGGTGHYGSNIVQSLLNKGEYVRVLSRNTTKARDTLGYDANLEIILGDITSRESVIGVLEHCKSVIIAVSAMSKKNIRNMKLIERDSVLMVLREAEHQGISRVLYLSAFDLKEDLIKKLKIELLADIKLDIERYLRSSNLDWTILGCPPTMELFFMMKKGNRMIAPGGGASPIPTIAPQDLGEIAAQAILRNDLGKKRFRITVSRAISIVEASKCFSNLLGVPIKVQKIPLTLFKILSLITRPFNPYIKFLYLSIKLMNNFPLDIITEVPNDHQLLLDTFNYTPTTLEKEIMRRLHP